MAAQQTFNSSNAIDAPAGRYAAITPSDTVDLTFMARAIYVGTGGNLVAVDDAGTAVTFTNVPDGAIIPIRVSRINATSTTATNMVALW